MEISKIHQRKRDSKIVLENKDFIMKYFAPYVQAELNLARPFKNYEDLLVQVNTMDWQKSELKTSDLKSCTPDMVSVISPETPSEVGERGSSRRRSRGLVGAEYGTILPGPEIDTSMRRYVPMPPKIERPVRPFQPSSTSSSE